MNHTNCQFRHKHTVGGIVFYKHAFLVFNLILQLCMFKRTVAVVPNKKAKFFCFFVFFFWGGGGGGAN